MDLSKAHTLIEPDLVTLSRGPAHTAPQGFTLDQKNTTTNNSGRGKKKIKKKITVVKRRSGWHGSSLLPCYFDFSTDGHFTNSFFKTVNVTFMCPLWMDNDFGSPRLRIMGA